MISSNLRVPLPMMWDLHLQTPTFSEVGVHQAGDLTPQPRSTT